MGTVSDESSEEFYDAADGLSHRNSTSGDEDSPVWPSFSQPKMIQSGQQSLPQRESRNSVPLLPAPPPIGTPRMRQSRSYQPTLPVKNPVEQKLSNGGTHQRGDLSLKLGLSTINSTSSTAEDTPTKRRRKLEELRSRLRSFEIGDEEREAAGDGEKISAPSDTSSVSDLASLASWSKHFLSTVRGHDIAEKTVVVEEEPTAVPIQEKIGPREMIGKIETSLPLKSSAPIHDSNSPRDVASPGVLHVSQQQIAVVSSSSSSSAASSKASTLEKSAQIGPGTPLSLAAAAAAKRRPSSARSSKSNSLTKDVSGLSACEHFLFSSDSDDLATLARKNSEAAEVIEALTSEIVRKAEIERGNSHKSSSSVTEPTRNEKEPNSASNAPVAAAAAGPAIPTGGLGSAIEEEQRRHSLRSGAAIVKEPDIVSSNRVREAGQSAQGGQKSHTTSLPNSKPSRNRRSVDAKLNSVGGATSSGRAASQPSLTATVGNAPDSTDKSVMKSVMLKNLDTGEKMPLIMFDDKTQQRPCINPLALHIMQLTEKEGNVGSDCADTDSESVVSNEDVSSLRGASKKEYYLNFAKQKTARYKKVLEKKVGRAVHKTVTKVKNIKDEVTQHLRKEESSQSDEEDNSESSKVIRIRASHHHKGPYHFDQIKMAQDLSGEHTGAVWSIKFSHCGRVMATAGQDKDIRVWVLKEWFNYFNNMRLKYSAADTEKFNNAFMPSVAEDMACASLSHSTSMSSLQRDSPDGTRKTHSVADLAGHSDAVSVCSALTSVSAATQNDDMLAPFVQKPFCVFKGHSADVLDLCWSKNFFLLSSSMDRTVRLWHVSRKECLCCFQHAEFVTAIAFLPKDDRYFLSVSLDGKLRVWHIPEKKVALWNEVEGGKLITALTFARNGKFVVVGTTDGRCVFYTTDQLKYHTQIDVKSSHGKNSRGHKVTGLDSFQDKYLLVTSSDSRIRLYDTRDLSLTCKYKGYYNYGSQIRASFSHDGKYIICGSEDKNVYLWKTVVDTDMLSLSVRKDRNRRWESIRAHNAVVTAAVFAPRPDLILQQIEARKQKLAGVEHPKEVRVSSNRTGLGEVLVTADFGGTIYVFFNKPKVKLGGSVFLPSY